MTVDIKDEVDKYSSSGSNKVQIQNNVLGLQNISKDDIYYKKDYHPNKTGAEIFAKIVGTKILSIY